MANLNYILAIGIFAKQQKSWSGERISSDKSKLRYLLINEQWFTSHIPRKTSNSFLFFLVKKVLFALVEMKNRVAQLA